MVSEWERANEEIVPPLYFTLNDFPIYIQNINECQLTAPVTYVTHSTYWLIDEASRILGTINIRHQLNDALRIIGGHIGYGIRPSEREKGYGSKILALALSKADDLGISKALITCDKDNQGSIKVIENNGGVLWSEEVYNGTEILKYWIDVKENKQD